MEIGILNGGHTRLLLHACLLRLGRLIAIDPSPSRRIATIIRLHPAGELIEAASLEALPKLVNRGITAEVIVVDGDHNYHTVMHELLLIDKLLASDGVVFVHDVCWPYGRRDMYYNPDRIPVEARHEFAMRGIVEGQSELVDQGGKNAHTYNATHEGGSENGVLTAVEDFVSQQGAKWDLQVLDEQYGLGILRRSCVPP
jgi:hypothetical protein